MSNKNKEKLENPVTKTVKAANRKLLMLTFMGLFTAIIFLMGFTPIGYLKVGVIEITFLTVPVVLGAMLFGAKAGAFLGLMFGITSFIQCFGMSAFGSTLLGINPLFTAVVCIVSRVLMGWLTGLIFEGFEKKKKTGVFAFGFTSLCGALLNTIFFVGLLILCFWNTEFIQSIANGSLLGFISAIVGINGVVEAIVVTILGTAIGKVLYTLNHRLYK